MNGNKKLIEMTSQSSPSKDMLQEQQDDHRHCTVIPEGNCVDLEPSLYLQFRAQDVELMVEEGRVARNEHNEDAMRCKKSQTPLEVSAATIMPHCDCHETLPLEGRITDSAARLGQLPAPIIEGNKQGLNNPNKQQRQACLEWLYKKRLDQMLQGERVSSLRQETSSADSPKKNNQKMQALSPNAGVRGVSTQERLSVRRGKLFYELRNSGVDEDTCERRQKMYSLLKKTVAGYFSDDDKEGDDEEVDEDDT